MNNNTILVLALVTIAMLSFKLHCSNEQVMDMTDQITLLENKNAEIAADRMLVLDSVEVLQTKLKELKVDKSKSIADYKKKTRAEKNNQLKQFGKVTIIEDKACIDSVAVDSINKLAIAYDFEVKESKTKDTIITHLTQANLQADSLLGNKDKVITELKKQREKQTKRAKTWQHISYGLAALTAIIWIAGK